VVLLHGTNVLLKVQYRVGADLRCNGIRNSLRQTIQSARVEVQTAVTVKCDAVQSGRDVLISSVNKHMMNSSHSL
jgi:hypothetical protein